MLLTDTRPPPRPPMPWYSAISSSGSGSSPATCETMNVANLVMRPTATWTSQERIRSTDANCSSAAAWWRAWVTISSVFGCISTQHHA